MFVFNQKNKMKYYPLGQFLSYNKGVRCQTDSCNRLQATGTLADVLSLITIMRRGVAGRCFYFSCPTARCYQQNKVYHSHRVRESDLAVISQAGVWCL